MSSSGKSAEVGVWGFYPTPGVTVDADVTGFGGEYLILGVETSSTTAAPEEMEVCDGAAIHVLWPALTRYASYQVHAGALSVDRKGSTAGGRRITQMLGWADRSATNMYNSVGTVLTQQRLTGEVIVAAFAYLRQRLSMSEADRPRFAGQKQVTDKVEISGVQFDTYMTVRNVLTEDFAAVEVSGSVAPSLAHALQLWRAMLEGRLTVGLRMSPSPGKRTGLTLVCVERPGTSFRSPLPLCMEPLDLSFNNGPCQDDVADAMAGADEVEAEKELYEGSFEKRLERKRRSGYAAVDEVLALARRARYEAKQLTIPEMYRRRFSGIAGKRWAVELRSRP